MPVKKKKTETSRGTRKKIVKTKATPVLRTEAYEAALKEYSRGLELLHKGELASAMDVFKAVETGNPNELELAERARTYACVCAKKLAPPPDAPKTPEESYYLGVVRANDGMLDEAIGFLDEALKEDPDSPKYLYARASAHALKKQVEPASADLRKAVELEPRIRFQAVNDPDFEEIRDEASFIDVIEPTPTGA